MIVVAIFADQKNRVIRKGKLYFFLRSLPNVVKFGGFDVVFFRIS